MRRASRLDADDAAGGGFRLCAGWILRTVLWGYLLPLLVGIGFAADLAELAVLQKRCQRLIVDQYKLAEAKPVVEQLLAVTTQLRGEEHQDMVIALHWSGYLTLKAGDYPAAQRIWERSLAIQEKLPGKEILWQVRALQMLGRAYDHQFNFERGEGLLKEALALGKASLGEEHPDTAAVRKDLDWHFENLRQNDPAKRKLTQLQLECQRLMADPNHLSAAKPVVEELLALTTQLLGESHPDQAIALHWSALLAQRSDNPAEAKSLWERSLALQEKLPGRDPLWFTRTLNMLGGLAMGQGDFLRAEELFRRALQLRESVFGSDHPATANTVQGLAEFYHEVGNRSRAEAFYLRAARILENAGREQVSNLLRSLSALCRLHLEGQQLALAEEISRRILATVDQNAESRPFDMGKVAYELGQLHHGFRNRSLAETCYRLAWSLYERSGSEGARQIPACLSALGALYLSLQDVEKAASLLNKALQMIEQSPGPEQISHAEILERLGDLQADRQDWPGARAFYDRGLMIREKLFGKKSNALVWRLMIIANLCKEQHQFTEAEALYLRCKTIWEELEGPDAPPLRHVWHQLGSLQEKRGNLLKARDCFVRACQISTNAAPPLRGEAPWDQRALARIDYLLGNTNSALGAADRIQEDEETQIADMLSFSSERQRMLLWKQNLADHRFDLWGTLGAVKPLARAALRTKGIVLDSLLEDQVLMQANQDEEVKELTQGLRSVQSRLDARFSEDASPARATLPSKTPDWNSLTRQLEATQDKITRKVPGFGKARRALTVQLRQVQEAIPDTAVLVEFLRYRHVQANGDWKDSYGALVISHSNEPRWAQLGDADAIDRNLKLYAHLVRLKPGDNALEGLLHELHQQLCVPWVAFLPPRTRQVILCPDGQLNFVSFAGLLTPSQRFLAEDFEISYVASGRDILAESTPASGSELEVWANPDFGGAAETSQSNETPQRSNLPPPGQLSRGTDLRQLSAAEHEGQWLYEHAKELGFERAILHVGGKASEAELSRVRAPQVIHFATHGFTFSDLSPAESSAFDREPRSDIPEAQSRLGDPMLRTGLALAGARSTLAAWKAGKSVPATNDGIVTAQEIGCLNLRGTRLAVLSACDSGLGEAQAGEGVLGLRRGFIQAGVQNLLLTLWPIEDQQTASFMPDLYAAIHRTGSPVRALAEVQRTWLKKLRTEKGASDACIVAGPFIISFQGKPSAQ